MSMQSPRCLVKTGWTHWAPWSTLYPLPQADRATGAVYKRRFHLDKQKTSIWGETWTFNARKTFGKQDPWPGCGRKQTMQRSSPYSGARSFSGVSSSGVPENTPGTRQNQQQLPASHCVMERRVLGTAGSWCSQCPALWLQAYQRLSL